MTVRSLKRPFNGYSTNRGHYWNASIEDWLESSMASRLKKKVNLIMTSPPFPLNSKKAYGNLTGKEYVRWLENLAPKLGDLLTDDGSLVVEIGNVWEARRPTMSTLPLETLLAVKESGNFHLCQEFICHNPARLPSPVQYVNRERCRVKDSWTRVWWLSRTPRPKSDNRQILVPYSKAMKDLLKRQSYNSGRRPSQYRISKTGFLTDHGGAIPPSCLTDQVLDHFGSLIIVGNTRSTQDTYLEWCRENDIRPHPARMQPALVAFFVSFLTSKGDFVLDPFGGSNTTGWVAETLHRNWGVVEQLSEYLKPSKARFLE